MSTRYDADDDFARKAKELFDRSVDDLDGETRSRLNRGRQAALANVSQGAQLSTHRLMQWAPTGGLAVAAVFALVFWTGSSTIEELPQSVVATDMEILLTNDDLEMIEDLEFYSWIDLSDSTNNVG